MDKVLKALGNALLSAARPRMLALMALPAVAAVLLWGGLAWIFWDAWIDALQRWLGASALGGVIARWHLSAVAGYLLTWLILLLLAPLTALMIAAVLAMPVIVAFVAARTFGALERRGEGSMIGSLGNAVAALLIYALLWIITLPLWLTGVLGLAVPLLTSAYLNQRLFRYDALCEHASALEYRQVVRRARWRLYLLGALLAPVNFVPLASLLAPVVSGLAFTYLCLTELQEFRAANATPAPAPVG